MIEYQQHESPITPAGFLHILWKRRKVVSLIFGGIVAVMVLASFVIPPKYEASAKVMVSYQDQTEKAYLLDLPNASKRANYDQFGSELVILKMRSILEPTVKEFNLHNPKEKQLDDPEEKMAINEAIIGLSKDLKTEREKDTNILNISYEDKDPILAAKVVDGIVKQYIKQRPNLNKDDRELEQLDEQIAELKARIDEIETSGKEYKSDQRFISPEHQSQILSTQIATYDQELTRIRSERIAKESRLNIIRRQISSGSLATLPDDNGNSFARYDFLNELKKRKLDLEFQKSTLEQKYTTEHYEMSSVVEKIQDTNRKIRQELNEILRSEEAAVQALRVQESSMRAQMDEATSSIVKLSEQEQEFGKLTRGVNDLQDVYSMYVRQREQARIAATKQEYLVQIRVLEPVVVPHSPSKPNKALILFLALILGGVMAVTFAIVLEYMDRSVNTVEEAQYCLGLPILAAIPEYKIDATEKSNKYLVGQVAEVETI